MAEEIAVMAEEIAACERMTSLVQVCVIAGRPDAYHWLLESGRDEMAAIESLHASVFGPPASPPPWPRLLTAPIESDTMDRDDAAEIVRLCNACDAPERAEEFLAAGLTVNEVLAALGYVEHVQQLVALARRTMPSIPTDFAETAIAERATLSTVREVLFETLAAASDAAPITHHKLTGDGRPKPPRP